MTIDELREKLYTYNFPGTSQSIRLTDGHVDCIIELVEAYANSERLKDLGEIRSKIHVLDIQGSLKWFVEDRIAELSKPQEGEKEL